MFQVWKPGSKSSSIYAMYFNKLFICGDFGIVCVFFVHASVCVCVGVCWDDSRCNVDMGNMCHRVRYSQIQDDSIQHLKVQEPTCIAFLQILFQKIISLPLIKSTT